MLPSKGRKVKVRRNYHMTIEEFRILTTYVRKTCGPKYFWAILTQFGMGFRSGIVVAINILDYQDDFRKLQWRDNKTDEVHVDPVPDFLRELTKDYVRLCGWSLVSGWMLPNHQHPSRGFVKAEAYEAWFCKVRKALAKDHPSFADGYWLDPCTDVANSSEFHYNKRLDLQFNNQWKYRIGTHSLRRLHRTLFAEKGQELGLTLHQVKEMCHYKDWVAFETYINHFKDMERHGEVVNQIYSPIIRDCLNGNQSQTRLQNY